MRKIIFSSSATVYRSDNIPPFRETLPLGTTNPYGTTKFVIEKILEDLAIHGNWSVTSLRYFNPIGAHPSCYIGESPSGIPNNLLPYVLDVALGKREKVSVFGGDYKTYDGTGIRDYIDVCDLVDAHVLAYQMLAPNYEAINIGTGKGTSVLEIIEMVSKISGSTVAYEIVPRRMGDLPSVYCDPSYAREKLGWKSVVPIQKSIENSWNFLQQ